MNKSSIFFSISITFISLLILILISFGVLYKGSEHRENFFTKQRSLDITHMIMKETRHTTVLSPDLKEYLEFMDFTFVADAVHILQSENKQINWVEIRRRVVIRSFRLQGKKYIHIKNPRLDILLVDGHKISDFRVYIFLVLVALLVAFGLLYITIINKLKPLRALKNKVINFGKENFDIECASDKKDEISQLANEFNKSALRLKRIKESRNVFIRNIMHELKTPIAKGHFLVQLPHTEENTQKMQKVFYRLESLINEFASIEELISTKQKIDKKEYYLLDIIDNASDLLMNKENSVSQEFDNITVYVDFTLFSIAVKNLMDNAIKYSPEHRVLIKTEGNTIVFENKGKELSHPLEDYFEAFFKDEDRNSNQGFGLGLYIVKHILDANNLALKYEYINGINRFIII